MTCRRSASSSQIVRYAFPSMFTSSSPCRIFLYLIPVGRKECLEVEEAGEGKFGAAGWAVPDTGTEVPWVLVRRVTRQHGKEREEFFSSRSLRLTCELIRLIKERTVQAIFRGSGIRIPSLPDGRGRPMPEADAAPCPPTCPDATAAAGSACFHRSCPEVGLR